MGDLIPADTSAKSQPKFLSGTMIGGDEGDAEDKGGEEKMLLVRRETE